MEVEVEAPFMLRFRLSHFGALKLRSINTTVNIYFR